MRSQPRHAYEHSAVRSIPSGIGGGLDVERYLVFKAPEEDR